MIKDIKFRKDVEVSVIPRTGIDAAKLLVSKYQGLLDTNNCNSANLIDIGIGNITKCILCNAANYTKETYANYRNECRNCIHYAVDYELEGKDEGMYCVKHTSYIVYSYHNKTKTYKGAIKRRIAYLKAIIKKVESIKYHTHEKSNNDAQNDVP